MRKYDPRKDFMVIRDFLVETYSGSRTLGNWTFARWNYARYFVVPLFGLEWWEDRIAVWENGNGDIVGVVHAEEREFGEVFLQRPPGFPSPLSEMLTYAEETFTDPKTGSLDIIAGKRDEQLQAILQKRGYRRDENRPEFECMLSLSDPPDINLPEGFAVLSMADNNDIESRRKVLGLAFGNTDPLHWPPASTYRELQKAPDYRRDLDLYVVAPNGEHVACCIVWYDHHNRLGEFEPVGTHPDYRRQGFGREVMAEGIRRISSLGAKIARVHSVQGFYEAVGFQKREIGHVWTKEF